MRTLSILTFIIASALSAGCAGSQPQAAGELESFRRAWSVGPCPPGGDCAGSVELLADGTLRLETPCTGDMVCHELPAGTYEVVVSAEEREAAIAALTDPALIAILQGGQPACQPPTDIFEGMTVVFEGATYDNTTTTCDAAPLRAARAALTELVNAYFAVEEPAIAGGGWSFGFCEGGCVGALSLGGAAARLVITGNVSDEPVYVDNTGTLTAEGRQVLRQAGIDLGDAALEETYGCPDCEDGGAAHVVLVRGGEISTHTYELGKPPDELAEIDVLVDILMNALEICNSNAYIEVAPSCAPRPE
jgi:hypothetical protein